MVGAYDAHVAFAETLGKWLAERNMRQSQLAAYIDVARSTVSAWANGKSIPKPEQCAALARVLHLPLEHVMAAAGYPVGQSEAGSISIAPHLLGLLPLLELLEESELEVMRHTALGLLELREARARYAAERRDESPPPAARSRPGKRRPRQPGPQRPPSA